MKKGFTLIELLGVIIVLGLIAVLIVPSVINQLAKSKDKTSGVMISIISSAADLYLDSHQYEYSMKNGDRYCITIETLIDEGFLTRPVLNPFNNYEYKDNDFVEIQVGSSEDNLIYNIGIGGECTEVRN